MSIGTSATVSGAAVLVTLPLGIALGWLLARRIVSG